MTHTLRKVQPTDTVTNGSPQGHRRGDGTLATTSSRWSLPVCLPTATLRVLCYFSNTGLQPGAWTISQAMPTEGAGSAHRLRAWLFADGLPNDAYMQLQTGPLLPPPLCIHWFRCGLNLYPLRHTTGRLPPRHTTFLPVQATAWLSTDRRKRNPNRLLTRHSLLSAFSTSLPTSVGTRGSVV